MTDRRWKMAHSSLILRSVFGLMFFGTFIVVFYWFNSRQIPSSIFMTQRFSKNYNDSTSDSSADHTINTSVSLENRDVPTVVTGYFNLGKFNKGGQELFYTHSKYKQWMTAFASIENPVVAFIETKQDFQFFVSIRSKLPRNLTKVVKVSRSDTWGFSFESRITEIFKTPDYPQHHPNTVVVGYSCATNAKYEFVQRAIRENPFHTQYFVWVDIGYFRDLTSSDSLANRAYFSSKRFTLRLPQNFSSDSVAYMEILPRNAALSAKEIVYSNVFWLAGGYFVGERSILYRYTKEYKHAAEVMLSYNLSSTDQQVIYFLFNSLRPKTKIQTYTADGRFNPWFHLGFISRSS